MKLFVALLIVASLTALAVGETDLTALKSSLEQWWGPEGSEGNVNTEIRPFKVKFTDEMVSDLRNRIKNRRKPAPPLEGVAFEYGFNSDSLDEWMEYWANEYNFTEREAFLNQFPQYKVNIQGLDIHYIHVKPDVPKDVEVVPVLMLHGWPGSVREFYEVIPLVTAARPDGFAVEAIVPSIPGFGFSDPATRPGMGQTEVAAIFKNFMSRLGHEKFYIQGGDFGALIANVMVTLYPDNVLGYHTNFPVSLAPGSLITWVLGGLNPGLQSLVVDSDLAERMYPMLNIIMGFVEELGYLHVQATKPDTVGIALADSPMGLFGYMMQVLSSGTRKAYKYRKDGGLHERYSPETVIDLNMLYWTENKFTTAVRLYAESLNLRTILMGLESIQTPVPTWTIHAKDEILYESPVMLKFKFPNLLHSTVLDTCGHFLALECPEKLTNDLIDALTAFREYASQKEEETEKGSLVSRVLAKLPIPIHL